MGKHTRFRRAPFRRETSGNLTTLSALVLPVVITLAAFAVDEGALFVERREAQSVTDLAAIAAATNIDKARLAAISVFADNGLVDPVLIDAAPDKDGLLGNDEEEIRVEPGRYLPEPTMEVEKRFVAGSEPHNAVQVTFGKYGQRYFSRAFFDAPRMSTTAIAGTTAQAAFSVGSRLARLDGGILNAMLGGLTGSELSLSVMDYEALVSADADLFSFFDVLAGRLGLEAGTYDDLLHTETTYAQLAGALAAADGVSRPAANALRRIERDTSGGGALTLKLADILDLGPVGNDPLGFRAPGFAAHAGALEMLTAAAAIANGENQVRLDLGIAMSGLVGATLDVAIGEPPRHATWFAVGAGGEVVRTAQTRLRLVVTLGGAALPGGAIRLPLYLDLAFAEAKLTGIECSNDRSEVVRVSVDARPGIADLRIADMNPAHLDDFRNPPPLQPARLVQLPLLKVDGTARVEIAERDFTRLAFDDDDIEDLTIKRVATGDITGSLFASLLDDLELDVRVAGLGIGVPDGITGIVSDALRSATPAIDALLVNVLTTLGVSLGEADIRVHGASCGRAVLVQ